MTARRHLHTVEPSTLLTAEGKGALLSGVTPTSLAADLAAADPNPRPATNPSLDGLEPGHRYAYIGPELRMGRRMGVVYVAPDGTLWSKPKGGEADYANANRAALTLTHTPANCRGCGTEIKR